MHADAQEGQDDLDAQLPPSFGTMAVVGLGTPLQGSRDIRPFAESADWLLQVDARSAVDDALLSWNTDQIPVDGLFLRETDGDGLPVPDGLSLDMRNTSQLIAPAGLRSYFNMHYGLVSFPITLYEGWTGISIPVEPPDPSVAVVLPGIPAIYEWGDGKFVLATEIVPKKGYRVFSALPEHTVEVRGRILSDQAVQLMPGWNFTGPVAAPTFAALDPASVLEPQGASVRVIWIWWRTQRYIRARRLWPGVAHWVYSDQSALP